MAKSITINRQATVKETGTSEDNWCVGDGADHPIYLTFKQAGFSPYLKYDPKTGKITAKETKSGLEREILGVDVTTAIATHAAISAAHHARYIDAEALSAAVLTGALSGAETSKAPTHSAVVTEFAKLAAYVSAASAGGAATEIMTVTSLLASDTVLAVTQDVPGANSLPILGWSTLGSGVITIAWAADPGAGAVVRVFVKHI